MSNDNNTNTETTTEVAKKQPSKNSIKKQDLTVEVLQESLELREDGNFYWKKDTLTSAAGSFAGSKREQDGYYSVVFRGTNYSGKQLAHFYKTGAWPERVVKAEVVKADAKPKTFREAPTITPEVKAAAKKAAAEKAAAKKAAEEAAKGEAGAEVAADAQVAE
jgi:hypothetical protein